MEIVKMFEIENANEVEEKMEMITIENNVKII